MSLPKILLSLSLTVAPLALASTAFAQTPPAAASGPAANVTTQLPRGIVPTHYAITVTPDAPKLRFAGKVAIDVTVTTASDSIVLNAADLTIGAVSITPAKGKAMAGTAIVDADAQTATLKFAQPLTPGQYVLSIDYAGIINTQANGLFALDYTDNAGKAKRALFTQFEAPMPAGSCRAGTSQAIRLHST